MAKIVETPDSLHVEIGMPRFNGSIAHFDARTRLMSLQMTNFFFKSKAEIPFGEISELRLMGTQAAAYPRIGTAGGKTYNLPSFSSGDAVEAVKRIETFLAAHRAG